MNEMTYIFFSFLKIHLFEREIEQALAGREGERDRENTSSRLPAQCRAQGAPSHNPENITGAEIKSPMLNTMTHPGAPDLYIFFFFLCFDNRFILVS